MKGRARAPASEWYDPREARGDIKPQKLKAEKPSPEAALGPVQRRRRLFKTERL